MRISDEHNILQIEGLSQRGRTLSIVDLLNANTLSVEMAAYLFCIMSHGASFLTAAKPGNAGKTTLMACILMFLPPDTRIVTVIEPSVISRAMPGNRNDRLCYLCHEIGAGHWYGYLWGDDVGNFFKLIDKRRSIASCIHADTLDEMKEILFSSELNVTEEDFRQFLSVSFDHTFLFKRKVCLFYSCTLNETVGRQPPCPPLVRGNIPGGFLHSTKRQTHRPSIAKVTDLCLSGIKIPIISINKVIHYCCRHWRIVRE